MEVAVSAIRGDPGFLEPICRPRPTASADRRCEPPSTRVVTDAATGAPAERSTVVSPRPLPQLRRIAPEGWGQSSPANIGRLRGAQHTQRPEVFAAFDRAARAWKAAS